MPDREKVIKGLETCRACENYSGTNCQPCPYYERTLDCREKMYDDALALLRELPPKMVFCPNCGAAVEVGK